MVGNDLEQLRALVLQLSEFKELYPVPLAIGFFVTYFVLTALSIPGAAGLTLIAGALFGTVKGSLLVSFASTAGAVAAMQISRSLLRSWVERKFPKQAALVNRGIETDGAYSLFALRLAPVVPFFVVNLVMGLTKIKLTTFAWVSQIGMLPATVIYVHAGEKLSELRSLSDLKDPTLWVALTALGVFPWVVKKIFGPKKSYDVNTIIIGGGAAGLVAASSHSYLQAKSILLEGHKMGGDCLNTGCVPSKALIHFAKTKATLFQPLNLSENLKQAESIVNSAIEKIAPHDSAERFRSLGVEVIQGQARIVDPHSVEVNGKVLTARSLILAVGAQPIQPQIPGLDLVSVYTTESIWNLNALPQRLLVVGGGAIGCELSQALSRLGVEVTLIERGPRLLEREEPAVAELILKALENSKVRVQLSAALESVTEVKANSPSKDSLSSKAEAVLKAADGSPELRIPVEAILFAVGRKPRFEGLGLENLGVEVKAGSLNDELDDRLRLKKHRHISVIGDASGRANLTSVAGHHGFVSTVNSLFSPWFSMRPESPELIPHAVFTDPEVARIGLTSKDCEARGLAFKCFQVKDQKLDRAITENRTEGFTQVLVDPKTNRIRGVTIVGPRAGDLIAFWTLAVKQNLKLSALARQLYVYPSWAEAAAQLASESTKSSLPGWVPKLLQLWHRQ